MFSRLTLLQKQLLDDRIESVVFRVEEFKSQLEHVQHNMVSNAEKVDDIHSYVQQLKDLYARVDQVEVRCRPIVLFGQLC